MHGWKGLGAFVESQSRIIHIQMGSPSSNPPGPSEFLSGLNSAKRRIDQVQVVSIILSNLPQPGPWALGKGPVALEMARKAMIQALDQPIRQGKENHHFVLEVDASSLL